MAKIVVEGLDAHILMMEELEQSLRRRFLINANQLGNEWLAETQNTAPYDTGKLSQSYRFDGAKATSNGLEMAVYNNIEYAAPVELGHRIRGSKRFVKGQHTLRRSRRKAAKALPALVKRSIDEAVGG